MALGTTNITIPIVRGALNESTDNLFLLGTSNLINKWSRHKPIREAGLGTEPATGNNAAGKFGFNLPTNWNYLQPRGGSWGGGIDEPVRIGDFRGYEHDRDVAGPVIYCLSGDVVFSHGTTITPSMVDNYSTGEWKHKANLAPHNNVKILPSDLGIENYYCGLHLTVGTLHFYKTGAQVNAIGAGGQVIYFDARITNGVNRTFEDFPSGDIGTYTWELFISSSQHAAWTQTTPTNYIALPGSTGETYGSKTIKATGTFTMNKWLVGCSADGATEISSLTWAYNQQDWRQVYLCFGQGYSGTPHVGINAADLTNGKFGDWFEYRAYDSQGTLVTNDFDSWDHTSRIEIRPSSTNSSAAKNANAKLGLVITHNTVFGNEITIPLVHENGTPPSSSVENNLGFGITSFTVNSGLSIGSNSLNISMTVDAGHHGNYSVTVSVGGSTLFSGTQHFEADGTIPSGNSTYGLSRTLNPGEAVVFSFGGI